jgi:hypothetical protein
MTEKTRRDFMKESSAAVGFSLSGIFSDILSSEQTSEAVEKAEDFFGPDDALMFNRGADPAHPYDTQFEDYFTLDYIEDLRTSTDSLEISNPNKEARSLTVKMDDVRDLPEGHPVRRIAEITPEPDISGLSTASLEESERIESELKGVVRDTVRENDGDWYDTWDKMEQDVEDVQKNVFEYSDSRREANGKLEIHVEDAVDLPDSYQNAVFGNEVYHGEEFDAMVKDGKAFIQFHDSEFYSSPEQILSEEKFEQVRNGEEDYGNLDRDQKAVFEIYRSSPLEKTFNF